MKNTQLIGVRLRFNSLYNRRKWKWEVFILYSSQAFSILEFLFFFFSLHMTTFTRTLSFFHCVKQSQQALSCMIISQEGNNSFIQLFFSPSILAFSEQFLHLHLPGDLMLCRLKLFEE